jgi:hypothetical protein
MLQAAIMDPLCYLFSMQFLLLALAVIGGPVRHSDEGTLFRRTPVAEQEIMNSQRGPEFKEALKLNMATQRVVWDDVVDSFTLAQEAPENSPLFQTLHSFNAEVVRTPNPYVRSIAGCAAAIGSSVVTCTLILTKAPLMLSNSGFRTKGSE